MKIIQTNKFEIQAKMLNKELQLVLKEILKSIQNADSISDLKSEALIGFPYLHTIEFGKYVIGIQVKNNEVELAGIVEKGFELSIFI